jgi:hypothetical protein
LSDVSDVENVLVSTIAQIVYPNGTASPSIVNTDCRIYRGWPIPANLDADLNAGRINISVYPQPTEQRTTRHPRDWQPLPVTPPTLTLTAAGTTITVGGTPSTPVNAAALVNGKGYVYAVQPGDVLATIATGLAALINADTPASSSGPVITVPGAHQIAARVGTVGTLIRETKRQKRSFQITCWSPTPALRDAIVPPIDQALADIDYLSLADGTGGRLLYERSIVSDRVERAGLYRRDLIYSVEYGTTDIQSATQIVTELFNITGPNAVTSFST